MGVELFGILVIAVLAVGAFFFFTGSFGIAKKGEGGEEGDRPTHAFVENDTKQRTFGVDSGDETRSRAEDDPDTEVRTPR